MFLVLHEATPRLMSSHSCLLQDRWKTRGSLVSFPVVVLVDATYTSQAAPPSSPSNLHLLAARLLKNAVFLRLAWSKWRHDSGLQVLLSQSSNLSNSVGCHAQGTIIMNPMRFASGHGQTSICIAHK